MKIIEINAKKVSKAKALKILKEIENIKGDFKYPYNDIRLNSFISIADLEEACYYNGIKPKELFYVV
ncbi:hypothetical protein [Campylobacter sp. MG1]|uniref:hypothetical protein n=1 Tax=Campylobacter sp. MG1 TaxID=2976332 RepID=UPI00226D1D6E|nr:hypothetical protein [Campylobacter sp. MG1]